MRFEPLAKTFKKKLLPESEVELVGEVPAEVVGGYRVHALAHIAGSLALPGFRKGKVPQDLAQKHVGEVAVLEEAVEHFVRDFYPELVGVLALDVVGRPNISITKLAPGNPVELTIRTALYPEVSLPKDWPKTGENIPLEMTLPATEEEVSQTIESLRASSAKATGGQAPPQLPEVTDQWAKTLGAFETVAALKDQVKKGIGEEKERGARDKRRGRIIDALLEKVRVDIPRIFVESELDKIISQTKEDVARFGVTYEDYLKQINKTEDALRTDFREQALKRAKLQLTLNKIAASEKVEPDKETVEREMKHALEHFPNAKEELVRIHIETVLRNEKVLQLLEKGEEK